MVGAATAAPYALQHQPDCQLAAMSSSLMLEGEYRCTTSCLSAVDSFSGPMTLDAAPYSSLLAGLDSIASDMSSYSLTLSDQPTTITGGTSALPTYAVPSTVTTPILPTVTSTTLSGMSSLSLPPLRHKWQPHFERLPLVALHPQARTKFYFLENSDCNKFIARVFCLLRRHRG
jgi:hypothetical protein